MDRHTSLELSISRTTGGLVVGLMTLASMFPAQEAVAQEVEIISGVARRAVVDPGSPGVRVAAFVQLEPNQTEHRVMDPLLPEEIFFVEGALVAAGYEPGVPDGLWSATLEGALTVFQDDRGLVPCGCVDYPTVLALGLRARVVQTVVGTPDDEPDAEVVIGPGRLPTPVVPERVEAPPETVVVVREVGNWWSYPSFFSAFPTRFRGAGPATPGIPGAPGFPFGPSVRLGAPRGGPPPR